MSRIWERRSKAAGRLTRRLARYRSSALRVLADLTEVDPDAGLVADDLGVVPRRDRGGLARPDLLLGAVVHVDLHPSGEAVAQMRYLARVGAGDRLEVDGPLPARLENSPRHGSSGEHDY